MTITLHLQNYMRNWISVLISVFLMDNFPEEKWADAYNDIMNGIGFGVKIEQIPYELHDFLFENHIDVFGLIEKGLAVDINTLSVQNDG